MMGIGLVLAMVVPGMGAAAAEDAFSLVCTNRSSGANWRITIDLIAGTVDSNPARISAAAIAWHDAGDGGNYTLDRHSGELKVIVASSTGGYILRHSCHPEIPDK